MFFPSPSSPTVTSALLFLSTRRLFAPYLIIFAAGSVSGFGSEREGYVRGIILVYI